MSILDKITLAPLPPTQYVDEVSQKSQLYVHHTASSSDPFGVIQYWKSSSERVGTAFIIAGATTGTRWKDGDIVQCFPSSKWAWHLGLKSKHLVKGGKTNKWLNMHSVGIEICNWGQLVVKNGKFITYAGTSVPESQVVEYDQPYRGFRFYHRYTDAQLANTRELLRYLGEKYQIPLEFKGMVMFDIDSRCLMGDAGVWTHTSCRPDKFDVHPQREMIEMLKSL